MADYIELVLGIGSLVVTVILAIVVYRWTRKDQKADKNEDKIEDMKRCIYDLQNEKKLLEKHSIELSGKVEKMDTEIRIALRDINTLRIENKNLGQQLNRAEETFEKANGQLNYVIGQINETLGSFKDKLDDVIRSSKSLEENFQAFKEVDEEHLRQVRVSIDKVKKHLDDVYAIAQYARKYSHEHSMFGKPV